MYYSAVVQLLSHSNSLQHHGLQHTRPHCPSLTPRACSNSCVSNQLYHPIISSSVGPFSFCPQAFPASGYFPIVSSLHQVAKVSRASASAKVLPKTIQGSFPSGLTTLISLQSKGLSRVFSNTTVQKHQFFGTKPSSWSNSHIHT